MAGKRQMNFSDDECQILVENVQMFKDILQGSFSDACTKDQRKTVWKMIVNKVNATGKCPRTVEQLQKKWTDLKCRAKKSYSSYKKECQKTGGGSNNVKPPNALEEKVISIMGPEACNGVNGGIDHFSELERLQNGGRPFGSGSNKLPSEERRFADIIKDKPIKVTVRVLVPAKEHPKFNFVGKLLGPKGNSLKRLQEDTMTKMAILGRGSMRDKHKEEELRLSGDHKFSHLNDDLHVEVTAFAPPAEAHARIAYALAEVRRFLVPDYNDDIRQGQMREMQLLNTSTMTLTSPTELLDTSSQVSPATSPGPSIMTPGGVAKPQNGRPMAYSNQQNGRSCFPLYNQQLLLHPAFRGLTPRPHELQLPNATVFRSNGSILNRLRPHPHLAATAGINNNRLSPPAMKQRNHGNSILSLLAGVPRSVFVGEGCAGAENVLLCAGEGGLPAPADDDVMGTVNAAAGVFGGYDNYAAAVNGNGHGYTILDGYGNGSTLMPSESSEELTIAPEAIASTGLSAELSTPRDGAGSVKMDRSRYRHDPYGRYTGIKLPL